MMRLAMALGAPTARPSRGTAASRSGAGEMACTDARMAACAMVSLHAPARLALDPQRAAGQVGTRDGLAHGPGDTPRRARLAPVSPEARRPSCTRVLRPLQRGPALAALGLLEGPAGGARAGPGAGAAPTRPGAACRHQGPRNGSIPSDP